MYEVVSLISSQVVGSAYSVNHYWTFLSQFIFFGRVYLCAISELSIQKFVGCQLGWDAGSYPS